MTPTASDAVLEFTGGEVRKTHRHGTDAVLLQRRLDAARLAPFVRPLDPRVEVLPDGRCRTRWPLVEVLRPDDRLPWPELGRLLARLHLTPPPDGLPPSGEPDRLARAVARASDPLLRGLGAELLASGLSGPKVFVHGDWHLGQVGSTPSGLLLLDIDDLGLGTPATDLGRPAGFWAAGLLPDEEWFEFLDAYLTSGGAGLLGSRPWDALDLPARRAVVIAAVRAQNLGLPEAEPLLAACRRMGH